MPGVELSGVEMSGVEFSGVETSGFEMSNPHFILGKLKVFVWNGVGSRGETTRF